MKCFHHKDRDAAAVCINCGAFVCEECRVVVGRRNYCKTCVNRKFSPHPGFRGPAAAVSGRDLALVALILAATFFLPRIGVATAVGGLLLGIVALSQIRKNDPEGEGASLAKSAVIIAVIGLLLHFLGIINHHFFFECPEFIFLRRKLPFLSGRWMRWWRW